MKTIVLFFSLCLNIAAFSQVTVQQPTIKYISKQSLEGLKPFTVGTKILFHQNCTKDLPTEVPNGIVFFDHVEHNSETFAVAISFKDTVVTSITYYLSSNQKKLLSELGLPTINASAGSKSKEWTFQQSNEKELTVIVGNKRRITVIKTLIVH